MEFIIHKDGKEITPEEAVSMVELSLYDPIGRHSAESPFYVLECLFYLKENGLIDDYETRGELPKLKFDPNVVY